ncbi:MAG: enoyl-CoA hydratase/isomerase family protein [Rhodocyclales bacterium]|nr:enoyl-CoA hydratase/isomerase family protein [Rhodocyclales bacterium]
MSKEFKTIQFRVEDNVGIITLNRPEKYNAISWDLAQELADLLRELRYDDDVRAIVLHGAGKSFCAGADAGFLSGDGDRPLPGTSDASRPIPRWQRLYPGGPFFDAVRQLVNVGKPVIAAIHGHAVGGGLAYALACDRRFGDTTVKMSAIFTNIGVAPDCGISWFLPRVVGHANALMMVETARIFKAEECKQLGLVDELVPEGKALETALGYARTIAKRASAAVDMARRMIYMSQDMSLEQMMEYEGQAGAAIAATLDAKEGINAFLEKRPPVYRGF